MKEMLMDLYKNHKYVKKELSEAFSAGKCDRFG